MPLHEYQRKRDFSKTSEPPPARERAGKARGENAALFVIQKHAASRLHYDFRLEMGGALKSWAVPKGIPFTHGEKRLAVHVEDHPLDYAQFEGIIPEGEYGGGTVMVWDLGEYTVSGADPLRALEQGKLHLQLHGKKLNGEWTLVRTRTGADGKDGWLLMKTGTSVPPVTGQRDDESALTARTMRQIAEEQDAVWQPLHLGFIPPMKPKLVNSLPKGQEWRFELKFDGYRAIAVKEGGSSKLYSRNEKPLRFPELAEAIAALPCETAILDGEIVALDETGHPSFQLLQAREMGEPVPICYYVFDLLNLNGDDLTAQPLSERKSRLAALLQRAGKTVRDRLRFSADLPGTADEVLGQITGRGLEGIVAKKANSRYEPGLRSGAWVKFKCTHEQEFVIGGYTEPQGARQFFGSLLVGYFAGDTLKFAGKVGTGFNDRLLGKLFRQLQEIRSSACPFVDLPTKSTGRWNQGITPVQMKKCTWVRPELVCQVKFTEWTRDGKLRQPVFLGLREDKAAQEVTKES